MVRPHQMAVLEQGNGKCRMCNQSGIRNAAGRALLQEYLIGALHDALH